MPAKWMQQLANPLPATWSSGTTVLAGARQKDAESRSKACGSPERSKGDAGDLGVRQATCSWTLGCVSAGSVEHPSLGGVAGTGWRGRGAADEGGVPAGGVGLKARSAEAGPS